MYFLIPHFLTKRYDAMNMITLDIPEEPMRVYMNQKRQEGRSVSHLALILTAYLRTVEEFPALNRFIMGRKIFQHNDLAVSMVVLKPGGNGEDTMSKIYLDSSDDVILRTGEGDQLHTHQPPDGGGQRAGPDHAGICAHERAFDDPDWVYPAAGPAGAAAKGADRRQPLPRQPFGIQPSQHPHQPHLSSCV